MLRRSLAALVLVRARLALSSFVAGNALTLPPLAVLVDGENIGADLAVHILALASNPGCVSVRRVYGNWNHPSMRSWQAVAEHYGFRSVPTLHPVSGKNAADIALTVDAMDLFHLGIRHFCLASSDSDYLPLVHRLREAGCFLYGVGKTETRDALRHAYHVFMTTDQLLPQGAARTTPNTLFKKEEGDSIPDSVESAEPEKQHTALDIHAVNLLTKAYQEAAVKAGGEWISTAQLGTVLQHIEKGFTPKSYGCPKLKGLIQKYPQLFQTKPLSGGQIALRLIVKTG